MIKIKLKIKIKEKQGGVSLINEKFKYNLKQYIYWLVYTVFDYDKMYDGFDIFYHDLANGNDTLITITEYMLYDTDYKKTVLTYVRDTNDVFRDFILQEDTYDENVKLLERIIAETFVSFTDTIFDYKKDYYKDLNKREVVAFLYIINSRFSEFLKHLENRESLLSPEAVHYERHIDTLRKNILDNLKIIKPQDVTKNLYNASMNIKREVEELYRSNNLQAINKKADKILYMEALSNLKA